MGFTCPPICGHRPSRVKGSKYEFPALEPSSCCRSQLVFSSWWTIACFVVVSDAQAPTTFQVGRYLDDIHAAKPIFSP